MTMVWIFGWACLAGSVLALVTGVWRLYAPDGPRWIRLAMLLLGLHVATMATLMALGEHVMLDGCYDVMVVARYDR